MPRLLSMLRVQVGQLLGPMQAQAAALWRITPGQEAFCIPSAHAFLSAVLDSSIAALRPSGRQTLQPKGEQPLHSQQAHPLVHALAAVLGFQAWEEESVKEVLLPDKGCLAQSTRSGCCRPVTQLLRSVTGAVHMCAWCGTLQEDSVPWMCDALLLTVQPFKQCAGSILHVPTH